MDIWMEAAGRPRDGCGRTAAGPPDRGGPAGGERPARSQAPSVGFLARMG